MAMPSLSRIVAMSWGWISSMVKEITPPLAILDFGLFGLLIGVRAVEGHAGDGAHLF